MPLGRTHLVLAAVLGLIAVDGSAQPYPHRPIRILVGFSPGGNADIGARAVATRMSQSLGTTVVVENRAGAAGSVAAQTVARAPADGYTLMWASPGSLAVNRILEKNLPYDSEKAFAPVGLTFTFCNALVARPDFAPASVAQLVAAAKEKPGQINIGSQGIGSAGFLSGQLMQQMAGIKLTHVPYKGGADVITALLGGELQLAFAASITAGAQRPRLKILAVTSPMRDPILPDVPTLDESGLKGYDATFWFGVVAPTGTPPTVINRLNGVLREVLADAELTKIAQRNGLNPTPSTPQELTARVRADYLKWKRVLEGS